MFQKNFSLPPTRGNHVEHAVGQSRLLPQFHQAQGALGHETGRFQDHRIAGGQADGGHPSVGNHGRKVPGGDAGEHADGMMVQGRVISLGSVHQGLAFHQVGRAACKFEHLNDLENVAHGLVPFFSLFQGQQMCELIQMFFHQCFHPVQHLHPTGDRCIRPGRISLPGGDDCRFHLFGGALGGLSDDLAGGRIVTIHVGVGFRFTPLSSDTEFQFFRNGQIDAFFGLARAHGDLLSSVSTHFRYRI